MDEQPALEHCVGPAVPVTVCNLEWDEASLERPGREFVDVHSA